MLINNLIEMGLNKKQAKIYLACLELGPTTILKLSQKTDLNRATIYKVIEELTKKKLITTSIHGRRKLFVAESPEKIRLVLKEKLSKFNLVLPELISLTNQGISKPVLKYYEGLGGIKKVYQDSLNAEEEFLRGFTGVNALMSKSKSMLEFWEKEHIPKRKKTCKLIKLIVPDTKEGRALKQKDETALHQTKLVPASTYNFKCEIFIYDNITAFVSYSATEEFALSVESELIAETQKMIWQMCWSLAY